MTDPTATNVIALHPTAENWPTPPRPAAFTGLAGEIARAIEPHSESDPLAILAQLLVCFGSVIGRGAHYAVEATQHHANEFVLLIGPSAKARKGSSWDHVQRIFTEVDPDWAERRIVSGLSSGEGVIWSVRDPDTRARAQDDQDSQDKRLLVLEAEFASVLKMIAREGNTLSPVIRCAWDGKPLQALTKNSPARATGAHISIVGHVTAAELVRLLNATEAANGFLNRYLLFMVRRSKLLPEGGSIDQVHWEPLLTRLRVAVDAARRRGRLGFDEPARRHWWELYPTLTEPQDGLAGAVCARAEAHVVRLALLYALLDQADEIGLSHLEAALALWEYVERSARWVFGDSLGDPLADEIYRALLDEPDGLTRSQVRDLFSRNRRSKDIGQALERLATTGRIQAERLHQRGRPAELWRALRDQPAAGS
ncbi:MAG: DUF3987 domain-containing protein [Solirubrobacteraceae bacterium]